MRTAVRTLDDGSGHVAKDQVPRELSIRRQESPTGYQLQSGEEMYSGEPISRMRTGVEFMTALVTMKLVDVGMNAVARKFIGEHTFALPGNALRDSIGIKVRPNPHGPRADDEVAKVADAKESTSRTTCISTCSMTRRTLPAFPEGRHDANYGYGDPPAKSHVVRKGSSIHAGSLDQDTSHENAASRTALQIANVTLARVSLP
ncbi:MAG: hypothetical protein H7Y19_18050 [Luteimonas sp.]|nr:hypothetical protein [Luteimonas sp.]